MFSHFSLKLPKALKLINEELENAERLFVTKTIALQHTITQLEKDKVDVDHYAALSSRLREMQKAEIKRIAEQKAIAAAQTAKDTEEWRKTRE